MTISFIIPIYNSELYLNKCIESIYNSSLSEKDIEVFLVDDSSTDDSVKVAKNLSLQYKNITVIEQNNQNNYGASVARNIGLDKAKGDYIWFIDSDDYLDSALVGKIKEDIVKNNYPDVFAIQLKLIDGKTMRIECSQPNVKHNVVLKGRDAILSGYQPSSVCAIICKRNLLDNNNLKFYEGISHEDVEFSMRAVALAQSVYFSDYLAYIYKMHTGSVSKSRTMERQYFYIIGDMYVALSLQKFAKTLDDLELQNHILRWSNNILLNLALSVKRSNNPLMDKNFKKKVFIDMNKHGVFPLKGPFTSWKIWLLSKLVNLSCNVS
ncbi:glycosyltransferase [uncultured Prevotella sp.]|uniref:glycosyltransferase family 2 protein n=1 Tax=uncultured Prevotella sp. TaxID=159272 RepID=UPI00259B8A51|nr:glycosyltransferase [uncultured Prevotella sp.]